MRRRCLAWRPGPFGGVLRCLRPRRHRGAHQFPLDEWIDDE